MRTKQKNAPFHQDPGSWILFPVVHSAAFSP